MVEVKFKLLYDKSLNTGILFRRQQKQFSNMNEILWQSNNRDISVIGHISKIEHPRKTRFQCPKQLLVVANSKINHSGKNLIHSFAVCSKESGLGIVSFRFVSSGCVRCEFWVFDFLLCSCRRSLVNDNGKSRPDYLFGCVADHFRLIDRLIQINIVFRIN